MKIFSSGDFWLILSLIFLIAATYNIPSKEAIYAGIAVAFGIVAGGTVAGEKN